MRQTAPLGKLTMSGVPAVLAFFAALAAVPAHAQAPTTAVHTAKVTSGRVTRTVTATGVLKPWRRVTVASQGSGAVTRLRCSEGQWVARDQVLAELDSELPGIAVEEAGAATDQAEAHLQQSITDLERARQLLEQHDISAHEWETLTLRKSEAAAGAKSARAQLQRAQRQLRDTLVRAPFSGVVSRRYVEVGSWLGPGQPVVDLVDLSRMKAEFGIPQHRLPELAIGQPAKLVVDLYPGVVFVAEVTKVGVVADPASGQFALEVAASQSKEHVLRPGMAVRLNLETSVKSNAVLVPREAVIERSGESFVFVIGADGRAQRRRVLLGSASGRAREVLDASLRVGEVVVTTGKEGLRDGDALGGAGPPP